MTGLAGGSSISKCAKNSNRRFRKRPLNGTFSKSSVRNLRSTGRQGPGNPGEPDRSPYTWYPIGEPGPSGMPRAYQSMKKRNQPTSMATAYGRDSDIRVPTPAFL